MASKTKNGFTLIELMVAMGIIAVLATMSIVAIQLVQRSTRNTQRTDILNTFKIYLQDYYNANNNVYPLTNDVTFQTDGIYVDGELAVRTSGPTTAASSTGQSGTAYCYISSDGSTYSLGLSREGGSEWGYQVGDSGIDCTTLSVPVGGN